MTQSWRRGELSFPPHERLTFSLTSQRSSRYMDSIVRSDRDWAADGAYTYVVHVTFCSYVFIFVSAARIAMLQKKDDSSCSALIKLFTNVLTCLD